jgi:hypothetical protein
MSMHSLVLPLPMTISRRARQARLRFLHELWSEVQIDTPAESQARDSVALADPARSDATRRSA